MPHYSLPWHLTIFTIAVMGGLSFTQGGHWGRTAVAASCSPRPAISVVTSVTGDGSLQTTLSGGSGAFRAVHVLSDGNAVTTNALVNLDGSNRAAPFSIAFNGPPSIVFTAQRQSVAPMTIHLDVEDDCGKWRTFVGAGTAAFQSGGDITGVLTPAGSGLQGGGTSGDVSLGLQTCAANQPFLRSNGATWACGSEDGDISGLTTAAGSGLQGGVISGDAVLAIQSCSVSLPVLRWTGTSWVCGSESTSIVNGSIDFLPGVSNPDSCVGFFYNPGGLDPNACSESYFPLAEPLPAAGVLSNFYLKHTGFTSSTTQFIIRKNQTDTALTCSTFQGATFPDGQSCSDQIHTANFAPGDAISLKVLKPVSQNVPGARWTARWTPS